MNTNRLFLSGLLVLCMSLSANCSDDETKDEQNSHIVLNIVPDIQIISLEQAVQLGVIDPQLQQRLALLAAANQPVQFYNQYHSDFKEEDE